MRDQLLRLDGLSSKKLDFIAAAIGSQRTAYFLQRRLIFALLGTLIAIFSVALFLGREAQAQATLDTGLPAPTLDTAGNSGGGTQGSAGGRGGGEAIAPVREKAAPLKQQTAPTQDLRSAPVSNPVYEQTAPAQEQITPVQQKPTSLERPAQPVYGQAALIEERSAPIQEQVTKPVQETAKPVVGTVKQTTDPVVEPVQQKVEPVAEPVKQTVEPVLDPVKDTVVKPVVDKVDETIKPVVDPVKETVDPVVKPVTDPVKETVDPDPVAAAAPVQHNEPVVGPTRDPLLRTESSPVVAPVLEEGGAALAPSAPVSSSALAAGKGVSLGASGAAPARSVLLVSNSEGSSSNGSMGGQQDLLTPTTSGRPAVAPLFFSAGEHSSIVDFVTTTVYGTSNQLPRSLPFSGALPAAGSAPGGSVPSLGGAGPDLGGVLTLLLIALLGGKFVWYAHQFLKPNSAFRLLINQPG